MVVKGTSNGNKRKIDDVLPSTTASKVSTPQSSPKSFCLPSTSSPPISAKLNNTVSRPRAQRKFAQGVVIPSPPVTPYKNKIPKTVITPAKKAQIPQYSPPVKRPKTEDFLTFLCYRGTSALPKSLNFFNFPSHYDRTTDFVKVKSRKELKSWRKDSQPPVQIASTSSSSTQRSQGQCVSDLKPNQSFKSAQKQTTTKHRSIEAIHKKPEKHSELGKVSKKSTNHSSTTVSPPLLSVRKPTHIDEKDAQFAISALKLKYQEKRLANSRPNLSIASKLAKKVKDRRVILTRSKSRDDVEKESGPNSNPKKLTTTTFAKQELARRNAPSPDIIDGVKLKQQSSKGSSSSEGESTSDNSSKSSSTKASDKSSVKKNTRSLRSGGKPVLDRQAPKSARSAKAVVPNRIATRASRRNRASPLRELPMYGGLKKRKKQLKKGKPNCRPMKAHKTELERDKSSHFASSSRRPSRKTKESAAFFLNLITKNFSSDDNDDNCEKSEEQSEGDTSSSETKFLETRYKAIMKRDEEKQGEKKRSESSKNKKIVVTRKSIEAAKPEKRILRSESSRRHHRTVSPVITRNTRRRNTVPLSPVGKPFHAGAARKSASVFPKKNKRSSSSSSRTSNDSSSSSSSEGDTDVEENHSCEEAKPTRSKNAERPKKAIKVPVRKPTKTSNSEDDSSSESEDAGPEPPQLTCSTGVTAKLREPDENVQINESSSSALSESESDDTSTSEDEESVVEKVEIAIQVDMDLEESLEQEASLASQQSEETPPPVLTPHFTSQGCQSDFSPANMSRPHHAPSITLTPQSSSQIPLPPPLLPFHEQSFYPTLTNFEFISQQRTQQDFSVMLPAIGLPTVSTYSFGPSTLLTPNQMRAIPIGYSSTATTLQTHIRSVAANLDIPLVRPVVTQQPNLIPSLSLTRPSQIDLLQRPLTRPTVVKPWSDTSRNHVPQNPQHYSAFRVPVCTTVMNGPTSMQRFVSSTSTAPYSTVVQSGLQQRFQPHPGITPNRVPLSTPQRSGHNHPGLSAHGLSLIQSLPNVSIVPKFDRNVKPVVIQPPDQSVTPSLSSQEKLSESKKLSKAKDKNGPPKEKGRKRKIMPFTKAPSPLLVRKDSTNPITYAGTSKKTAKGKDHPKDSELEPTSKSQFNQLILRDESGKVNETSTKASTERSGTPRHSNGRNDSAKCPELPSPKKDPDKDDEVCSRIAAQALRSSEPEIQIFGESPSILGNCDADKNSKKFEDKEKTKRKNGKRPNDLSNFKKGGTESPRAASVSSERSSRMSESHEEVKVEDILAYYPTEEEFQDPLNYIQQIQEEAQQFGIARIVPPKSFRPECNVEDDMRFTAYNHYIHRMHKRWGPNVHVRAGIMENLIKSKVRVTASNPPIIGGMEVDLTTLYHTVQSFGGLTEVIQKDKWNKVSDAMNIPKAANDRASKLDAIYVKYVLPYEMLSDSERKKVLNEVEKKWKLRQNRDPESETESDEDDPLLEVEDCIIKGKSTPLSSYYRVARNTINMLFKTKEPSHSEVESAYWKLVRERDRHLCVYSGSIDCAGLGWGFPLPKTGAKHPWNLKVLASNPGSILKSMGNVMGATVPTLHVGMVFTTYCWYRDPHNLPWVEYLHSGGNKIWYVIPASHETGFRQVLKEVMPRQCKEKQIWLTSDSAMVPPEILLSQGIPLYRAVQNPGEFLVVFPKAFTSAICTGYVISESVCFATPDWLQTSLQTFQDFRDSKEPPVFPLEKLILSILTDSQVSTDILQMALPVAENLFTSEITLRKKLRELGIVSSQKTIRAGPEEKGKKSRAKDDDEAKECDICNYVLHLSMVTHKSKKVNYCLPHAVQQLAKTKSKIKASSLLFDETDAQLRSILETAQSRLK